MAKAKWTLLPHPVKAHAYAGTGPERRIQAALEASLKLDPKHAETHTATGTHHAEVIGKVGALVGSVAHRGIREAGKERFRRALYLAPDSAIAFIEFANGLVMMHGGMAVEEGLRALCEVRGVRAARWHGEARLRGGGGRVRMKVRRDSVCCMAATQSGGSAFSE